MHLGKVFQANKETLRSYVQRFNLEALQIPNLNESVAFDSFFRGLRDETFKFDIVRKDIRDLKTALKEAYSCHRAVFVHQDGEKSI